MLDNNSNKTLWVGIAVGIVAILGISAQVLYPSALGQTATQIKKMATGFANPDTNQNKQPDAPEANTLNVNFQYNNSDKTATAVANSSDYSNKDIVIPDHVKNNVTIYTITTIGSMPKSFNSIKLPSTITTIDDYAFYKATIKSGTLTIPNGVTTIGESAFDSLKGVPAITLPNSVTTIGASSFNNSSFQQITLSNQLQAIPDNAFSSSQLTSINIPGSVKSIGNAAFQNSQNLGSATIQDGVQSIGNSAFDLTNLENINLPDSLKSIGDWAISNHNFTKVNVSLSKNTQLNANSLPRNNNILTFR